MLGLGGSIKTDNFSRQVSYVEDVNNNGVVIFGLHGNYSANAVKVFIDGDYSGVVPSNGVVVDDDGSFSKQITLTETGDDFKIAAQSIMHENDQGNSARVLIQDLSVKIVGSATEYVNLNSSNILAPSTNTPVTVISSNSLSFDDTYAEGSNFEISDSETGVYTESPVGASYIISSGEDVIISGKIIKQ